MNKFVSQKKLYTGKNLRIGILGGTFDPPHSGHLYMANEAMKRCYLDRVVFMPCGMPKHKDITQISESKHRIQMIKIATRIFSRYHIDKFEIKSNKPSYSIDSVMRIQSQLHPTSKMFFIIGADSLLYLDEWYEAKQLLGITDFIVIPRTGVEKEKITLKIKWLNDNFNAKITYINCAAMDVSSTSIRNDIEEEGSSKHLESKVKKYILRNGLYKNDR